jgi:RES domain-containing protein
LSGRGAELYGGRFNPKGVPALYASTEIMTAVREANQAGDLQPTTLVSYRAEIEVVFDATDATALAAVGFDDAALADPKWRDQMRIAGEARTQRFARNLMDQGYNGLLVRSFAKGAASGDLNLVLWRWSAGASSRLELIDDERRLLLSTSLR